jgi:hypothetical protein
MALLLAATDLGIGSSHVGLADIELARELLSFPEPHPGLSPRSATPLTCRWQPSGTPTGVRPPSDARRPLADR